MMDWDIVKSVSAAGGAVVALAGFFWGLRERRGKKRAEDELKKIRRRGDAPFFRPSDELVGNLYHQEYEQILFIPFGSGVLCSSHAEVKLEDGQPVFFVVENHGRAANSVVMKLDGGPISLRQEPDIEAAHGLQYLVYPYSRAKHGQDQELVISFETESGVQDTHRYVLRHGMRFLRRVDPPLPQ